MRLDEMGGRRRWEVGWELFKNENPHIEEWWEKSKRKIGSEI